MPQTNDFRRSTKTACWVLLALAGLAVGAVAMRMMPQECAAQGPIEIDAAPPAQVLFQGWKQPALSIIISGQMDGYLQPCGCSSPQYGGLARRYNFLETLKMKNWATVGVDLGDLAPLAPPNPQSGLKYATAMKALNLMDVKAVGLGKNEMLMPLLDALAEYSIDFATPRPVAMNMHTVPPADAEVLNVRKYEVVTAGGFRLGIFGAVGPKVVADVTKALPMGQKSIEFTSNTKAIPGIFEEFVKQKVDLAVMLYQGDVDDAKKCAEFVAKLTAQKTGYPRLAVIVCMTTDEDPASVPTRVENTPTQIITTGHRGRYVGVLGLYREKAGVQTRYQLVRLEPEYQPKETDTNAIVKLMEEYTTKLKQGEYLAKFPHREHPTQGVNKAATYVGSERCAACHDEKMGQDIVQIWRKSDHAHAFKTLVNSKQPSLRQFDGECVVCHTVGFQYRSGYDDPPKGTTVAERAVFNNKLENVGCESCHGPGSLHAQNSQNVNLYPLINPFRPSAEELDSSSPEELRTAKKAGRMNVIDRMCMQCHNDENDVHWNFKENWKQVAHSLPRENVAAGALTPQVKQVTNTKQIDIIPDKK